MDSVGICKTGKNLGEAVAKIWHKLLTLILFIKAYKLVRMCIIKISFILTEY